MNNIDIDIEVGPLWLCFLWEEGELLTFCYWQHGGVSPRQLWFCYWDWGKNGFDHDAIPDSDDLPW